MNPPVEIAFSCLPLRSVGRLDIPLDASPEYRTLLERIKRAWHTQPAEHTYYLHQAHAVFRLANSEVTGMLRFEFEGTVTTDAGDRQTEQVDLSVELAAHTCTWWDPTVEAWWKETVQRAVAVEFDRYIASGSLARDMEGHSKRAADGDLGMHV